MLLTEKATLLKIKKLEAEGFTWKPLGGNANNEGLIQMLTDPGAGLAERITNAIDAVLEKYYLVLHSQATNPSALATEIKNHLPKNDWLKLITVKIHDSESKDQDYAMSIEITDKGIGISGEDFENTILKLSGDNKLTKKYLMGAYGQGGSTSIKFNSFTIIYSKSQMQKEVMTIIRYNPGTSEMKNGSYEYIVKEINGVSHFAPSFVLDESGTKVINIATYHKKQLANVQFNKTIRALLSNRLFCPPLPFILLDKRKDAKIKKETLILGARKELEKNVNNHKYCSQKTIITDQNSKVFLRWWVIMPTKNDHLKKLVDLCLRNSRSPFNFTMNGQTQGYVGYLLLDECELSFLKKRFVCEIDITNITKQEKRSILSSSREKIAKDSDFWEELKHKIIDYFINCHQLKGINKEIREMMTSTIHSDNLFTKQLNMALRSFGARFAKGYVSSTQNPNRLNSTALKQEASKTILKVRPTYFNLKGSQPLEFTGDNLKIRYETDGIASIVLDGIHIFNIPGSLELISKNQDHSNGIIIFDAKRAPLNEKMTLTFNVLNGLFVKEIIVRKIDPFVKPKKPGYPKTKITFIKKESEGDYNRLDFSKQIPCRIEYSKQTNRLAIFINLATYPFLGKYLKKPKLQEQFKSHYSLGLSLYVISQIQKYEYENSEINEAYDYNPIAKNLIWGFDNIQKIK